jgi:hypothetical protein
VRVCAGLPAGIAGMRGVLAGYPAILAVYEVTAVFEVTIRMVFVSLRGSWPVVGFEGKPCLFSCLGDNERVTVVQNPFGVLCGALFACGRVSDLDGLG